MFAICLPFTDMKESANAAADLSSNKSESVNGALTDHRPVSSLSLRSVSSELFQILHDKYYENISIVKYMYISKN